MQNSSLFNESMTIPRKFVKIITIVMLSYGIYYTNKLQEKGNLNKNVLEYQKQLYLTHLIGCFDDITHMFKEFLEVENCNLMTSFSTCSARNYTHIYFMKENTCVCCKDIVVNILTEQISCKHNSQQRLYVIRGNEHLSTRTIQHYATSIRPVYHANHNEFKISGIFLKLKTFDVFDCYIKCGSHQYIWATLMSENQCFCYNVMKSKLLLPNFGHEDHSNRFQIMSNESHPTYVEIYRTLKIDENCFFKKTFVSDKKSFPYLGILSFPGSGNTWFRHLLEMTTGYYSGSVYDETEMFSHGFFGETVSMTSNKILGVKDHVIHRRNKKSYEKIILIIRNPYDALQAEFNRKNTGHVGIRNESDFETTEWSKFVLTKAEQWKQMHFDVLRKRKPTLIIMYDDLLTKKKDALSHVLSFLGIKVDNEEERLKCVEKDSGGFFQRHKKSSYEYFTNAMVSQINSCITEVRIALLVNGFHTLPPYENILKSSDVGFSISSTPRKNKAMIAKAFL